MNMKKYDFINFWKLWGLIALIIVSGIGIMTVMSLQIDSVSGTVIANIAEGKYYGTLYGASDYKTPFTHDGNPFVYDFVKYEGKSLDLTLTPEVLAIDSVYLMRIGRERYSLDGVITRSDWGSFIKNPNQDIIKIAEYDLPTNVVSLGIVDIPENDEVGSSWWLVCFCANMGYCGGLDNNPDGRIIIDIVVL